MDEWDLRKVIRRAYEECVEAQPETNNDNAAARFVHPVFGTNMDIVDNYEFVDEASEDDMQEEEDEEEEE